MFFCRFSAVTCTSIARKQPRSSDARQKDVPKLSAKSSSLSKCLEKQDEKPTTLGISKPLDKQDNLKFMENHISKPTLNEENDSKAPETDALVRDGSSISLTGSKETSKKKVEGNGLANLWGRASVKPKPISGQADIDSSIKIEVSTPGNKFVNSTTCLKVFLQSITCFYIAESSEISLSFSLLL